MFCFIGLIHIVCNVATYMAAQRRYISDSRSGTGDPLSGCATNTSSGSTLTEKEPSPRFVIL